MVAVFEEVVGGEQAPEGEQAPSQLGIQRASKGPEAWATSQKRDAVVYAKE